MKLSQNNYLKFVEQWSAVQCSAVQCSGDPARLPGSAQARDQAGAGGRTHPGEASPPARGGGQFPPAATPSGPGPADAAGAAPRPLRPDTANTGEDSQPSGDSGLFSPQMEAKEKGESENEETKAQS